MIHVTYSALLSSEEVEAQLDKAEAGTIETPNGEISDSAARTIAHVWGRLGSVMSHLALGIPVVREDLLDDISTTARMAMGRTHQGWPRELEHLSTWVINHE